MSFCVRRDVLPAYFAMNVGLTTFFVTATSMTTPSGTLCVNCVLVSTKYDFPSYFSFWMMWPHGLDPAVSKTSEPTKTNNIHQDRRNKQTNTTTTTHTHTHLRRRVQCREIRATVDLHHVRHERVRRRLRGVFHPQGHEGGVIDLHVHREHDSPLGNVGQVQVLYWDFIGISCLICTILGFWIYEFGMEGDAGVYVVGDRSFQLLLFFLGVYI